MILPELQLFVVNDYKGQALSKPILTNNLPKFTQQENNANDNWESDSCFSGGSLRWNRRQKKKNIQKESLRKEA